MKVRDLYNSYCRKGSYDVYFELYRNEITFNCDDMLFINEHLEDNIKRWYVIPGYYCSRIIIIV